ncbi:MAG: hypothetical protein EB109_01065 [Methylophilaceae bacterium]|jgi:uncharacterized membrane protein YkoI|nr:hypothetical protein [Methylophilaceae bacterium]NDF80740.1 hypothetical protein [Methylophilaceae bacterium]
MKKYLALVAALLVAGLVGAVLIFGKGYKHDNRPTIVDIKKHNEVMSSCMKTALVKHPGAIIEIEMETEDGRPIFDIDIQGADGKHWEIECDAELATVVEDNIDRD